MSRVHGRTGATMYRRYGPIDCSCIIGTSAVRGRRMSRVHGGIYIPDKSQVPTSMQAQDLCSRQIPSTDIHVRTWRGTF